MSMKRVAAILASTVLLLAPAAARAADAPAQAPVTPATTAPAATKLRIQVAGRVKNPGTLQFDAGARLSDALTAAGADFEKLIARIGGAPVPDTDCVLGGPALQYVYLMRTTESSKVTGYVIDVSIARQQHDLRYDPLLQDNDRIFVPECRPKFKIIWHAGAVSDTSDG